MIESMEAFDSRSYTCMKSLSRKFTGRDGRRHVLLCGGTGCLSSNSDEIYKKIKQLVEDLDMTDRVEVNQVGC
ncbi:MAG: (2Fe-2S) ferredoxin domain-containing protein, partial [Atopobiaceae bacterium]|nr:(2Fe-2S) ferredoxin domain-containing protein [Atopobiaceae bacterium]